MQSTFEDQIPSEPIHPGPGPNMCENNNTQSIADYLAQLLKDKKQLAAFPNVFLHLERLLDDGKHLHENLLHFYVNSKCDVCQPYKNRDLFLMGVV